MKLQHSHYRDTAFIKARCYYCGWGTMGPVRTSVDYRVAKHIEAHPEHVVEVIRQQRKTVCLSQRPTAIAWPGEASAA